MYLKIPIAFVYFIVVVIVHSCNNDAPAIKKIKRLPEYSSGSALAFFNEQLYLMGDDAANLLLLDTNFTVRDSIRILDNTEKRIPKSVKPDLESIAVFPYQNKTVFLLMGSGSKLPYRNYCWVITPNGKQKERYDLLPFYRRLSEAGIKNINIEGSAAIPGGIVLANRGNKSFRRNHLIFIKNDFFINQDSTDFNIMVAGTNTDTSIFNGISGMEYASGSDKLILTVSTENTYNSYSDGAIGKSYLWIINDISTRKKFTHINPDRIIDLEKTDNRFKGHKIETVCIISETRSNLNLVLAADDDNGETMLFKLLIKK